MNRVHLAAALAVALLLATLAGCGDTSRDDNADAEVTLRLLTHDSFAVSDGVLEEFTKQTGIEVELLQGGDAGTVVNQAILAKGNPQADVLFGIDSTFLTRALDEDIFSAYRATGLDEMPAQLKIDPTHHVTPVDYGDVCVNYDKQFFAKAGLAVPQRLADLIDPRYRDLLVVENPATSSPGLAFLLASVDAFGADGWQEWWKGLRANGVEVVDGWEDAYYGSFSGGGASEGDRPLVVSYASSPPAEVVNADPPLTDAPTGVMLDGCYRQVEGAGILRGSDHAEAAGRLLDFMLSRKFQDDVAQSMYVFPVMPDAELPAVFVKYAAKPPSVLEVPAAEIDAQREDWIDEWTDLVVR